MGCRVLLNCESEFYRFPASSLALDKAPIRLSVVLEGLVWLLEDLRLFAPQAVGA